MTEQVRLGITADNECIYLTKHSWDCDWYWGFGYVGNKNHHFHIDSLITAETDVNKIFADTNISQAEWWVIRDLFIQAYALKKAAEVYRLGGHQCTVKGVTDVIKNSLKEAEINVDLKRVLDLAWQYVTNAVNK